MVAHLFVRQHPFNGVEQVHVDDVSQCILTLAIFIFFWYLHPVHPLGYIRIEAKFGVFRFHSSPKGVARIRTRTRLTKANPRHHWTNTYLV